MIFSFLDAIHCIKHFSLPRISNVEFPRREITRKCRDRTDTLREIGSPRRAYHASSLAARRAIYFSLGIRSSPVIALPTITVLKVTRIVFWRSFEYTFPSLYSFGLTRSLLVSLLSSFSLFFSTSAAPSLALLTLSRSCVSYVRTNSISRDSLRSGSTVNYFSSSRSCPALFRTCALLSLFPLFPYSPYSLLSLFLLRLFRPTL